MTPIPSDPAPGAVGNPQGSPHRAAAILVVDDSRMMRLALVRALHEIGFENVKEASDGRQALDLVRQRRFDLMLLDIEMPVMTGLEVLQTLRGRPPSEWFPVIVVSGSEETGSAVRCIEAGAEDYLPKPFNPTLLRARVTTSIEKKHLRDLERLRVAQLQREKQLLERTQRRLEEELAEAARYVASILPPPMETPFRIVWSYLPSTELAGDSFGYHWIDDTHFAIYLLDVCGHGIGAALLSVAAIQMIRAGSMAGVDFRDPSRVLAALNAAFPMDRNNNSYFTLWYGVHDTAKGVLQFASAGHPPALLVTGIGTRAPQVERLGTGGMIIGGLADIVYPSRSVVVPPGSRLFVYCDGAFEIELRDGSRLDFDAVFVPRVMAAAVDPRAPAALLEWARSIHRTPELEDDFSMMAVEFPVASDGSKGESQSRG
jgi:sigma-B regulation protein RsbU (phosphoserine phosphatase)